MRKTITNTLLLCSILFWNTIAIASNNLSNSSTEVVIYDAVFEGIGEVSGKASGAKGGTWIATSKKGCDKDGNEFFGTRDGKFEITNYEGSGCDNATKRGGANDNEWSSGTINVREYSNINVRVQLSGKAAKGGFESNPKVCPPMGACVDQISVFVSLDGETFSKVYHTEENEFSTTFEEAQNLCGQNLLIRVEGGTQASNESFFIDRVVVTGIQNNLPIANEPEKVCYGEDVSLSIKNAKDIATINWYDPNGAKITSAENSKLLTISNIQSKDAGIYHAIITAEELGCGKKEMKLAFEVVVANGLSEEATIVLSSGEEYACKGDNITLQAKPNSRSYNYVWFGPDGNEISYCKDAAVCRISDVEKEDAGKYLVKISDPKTGICTLDEAVLRLEVIEGSGKVTMVGDNPFEEGSTAKVKVKTENSGKYNYIWVFPNDSQQTTTETNGTLLLKDIRATQAGIYKLHVSNTDGTCKSTVEYLLNVEEGKNLPSKKVENTEFIVPKTTKTANANATEPKTNEKPMPVNLNVSSTDNQAIEVIIAEGNVVEFTHKGTLQAKTGLENAKYAWFKDGVLVGETAALEVYASGNYTIIIQSEDGKHQSSTFTKVIINGRSYTVKMGDDLKRIARLFYNDESKAELLKQANHLEGDNSILKIGTEIIIPSEEAIPTLDQGKVLLSAVSDFAPFSGRILFQQGILSEVTTQVFEAMEQETKVNYMTWNEAKAATLSSHTLGIFPLPKNKSNEQFFELSTSLYQVSNVFFERKETNTDISKPAKLKGKKVAILQGYEIPELTEWHQKKYIQIHLCKSLGECFELLDKGTVDLVATAQFVGLNQLKTQYGAMDHFGVVPQRIGVTTLHFAMAKQHPLTAEIIAAFNENYEALKKDGTIRAIENRHIELIQGN
ncbi:MAG: transporter substrate-binding domain-containing protein [Bacteroidota bacterium]